MMVTNVSPGYSASCFNSALVNPQRNRPPRPLRGPHCRPRDVIGSFLMRTYRCKSAWSISGPRTSTGCHLS